MKYSYTSILAYNLKGQLIKRPLIELEFFGHTKNQKPFGFIDSGADSTLLNIQYAERLGISLDPNKMSGIRGVSDKILPGYVATVEYKVKHFDTTITTPVVFLDSPAVDVLLGQEGFFEFFRVKFEKDHDTFELSLSPKLGN